jgi:hypothetical protein
LSPFVRVSFSFAHPCRTHCGHAFDSPGAGGTHSKTQVLPLRRKIIFPQSIPEKEKFSETERNTEGEEKEIRVGRGRDADAFQKKEEGFANSIAKNEIEESEKEFIAITKEIGFAKKIADT